MNTTRYAYEGESVRHTPAQALYDFLLATGWVHNKRQFADLVGVDAGNIYNYLADVEKKNRIPATQETLGRWCATISTRTGGHARVSFVTMPNGTVEMEASGFDQTGAPVESRRYRTVHAIPQVPSLESGTAVAG